MPIIIFSQFTYITAYIRGVKQYEEKTIEMPNKKKSISEGKLMSLKAKSTLQFV